MGWVGGGGVDRDLRVVSIMAVIVGRETRLHTHMHISVGLDISRHYCKSEAIIHENSRPIMLMAMPLLSFSQDNHPFFHERRRHCPPSER